MGKPFVNLHTHSCYSILEAVPKPQEILEKAKELGCEAVALTDTGNGHGLVEFVEQAKKVGDIKPIVGTEIALSLDSRFEKRAGIDGKEGSLVLLAQNEAGYKNILTLISQGAMQGFYHQPRIDLELLEEHKEGVVCLTGSESGVIARVLDEYGEEKATNILQQLKNIFEDRLYLELVGREYAPCRLLNEYLLEQVKQGSYSLVVTSDSRYLSPGDEESVDNLYCIGQNLRVDDSHRTKFAERNWFKSFEEITLSLDYIDADILEIARENTLSIAKSCTFEMQFDQDLLPRIDLDEGETPKSTLRKNCEKGLELRFPKRTDEEEATIRERLDYELSIIGKMGFEAYFLIVEDFIRFAKESGIAVGPGRGSAAGSLVSYLLEITNIDPLAYDLLFERFLNPERISMPDVDIDFSDERREEVATYVIEKYGAEKVSRVCTFGTLSAKAALKDVGRVQGVDFGQMNALTKLLPNKPGFKLDDAEEIQDFKVLVQSDPKLSRVFRLAKSLEGCVRHVSVHACAVIIGKDDLMQYAPVQWAPGSETVKITQYPYQQLEHVGLLKMDFLGLKNLSILEKAISYIKQTTGQGIDLDAIPVDDKKTFEMMARGETTGVFQFESAGMRRYLRELQPTEFEDLVAMNALYRPGPMEYIPDYIKGKHDPETVEYLDPALKPLLSVTYGIAVYQEQVLKIAQVMGGFSLGEADILRKAIGKKIASILDAQRTKFIKGAVVKGFTEKLAIKVFDEIVVPFSGYGFNRSHAVCYARIAYETAYLRANYPVEFMAAMMTTDRNNTDRIVLEMNECASMGIEVLPPSIQESGAHFTVVDTVSNNKNEPLPLEEQKKEEELHTKSIRFGLGAIKGLGEETVNQIIFERKSGDFVSLQDFAKRVPAKLVNKKTLEALAYSGAFDVFGDRGAVVASLDELSRFAKEHQEKQEAGQIGLFGGIDDTAIDFTLKDTKATKEDILGWEKESLGLFVSDHPLREFHAELEKQGNLIGTLTETDDVGEQRTIHGIITDIRKIVTRKGDNMAIVRIEDTTGNIEGALFPRIYANVNTSALVVDKFVRIRGKIQERDGNLNIIINDLSAVNPKKFQKEADSSQEQKEVPIDSEHKISLPQDITKSKLNDLKVLFKEASFEGGESVILLVKGMELRVPFKVRYDKTLKEKIERLLKT